MAKAPDPRQYDLLTWDPPSVVDRYEPTRVKAASWRDRIAKAVSETLSSGTLTRDEIAERMTDWLGEDVSRAMLDAYASQAKTEHTIPFVRVVALIEVTGDTRLLQMAAEACGRAVIEERYLGAIEAEMVASKLEDLEARRRLASGGGKGRADEASPPYHQRNCKGAGRYR